MNEIRWNCEHQTWVRHMGVTYWCCREKKSENYMEPWDYLCKKCDKAVEYIKETSSYYDDIDDEDLTEVI